MTAVIMEEKQSKIQEFSDLLGQRNNAEQKQKLGLELSEYETNLINSPYKDWLLISSMLGSAEIEEELYEDFLAYPTHYKIVDMQIVLNENWQAEELEKEQRRIGNLHITKQDFYNNFCKPVGISYADLVAKVIEVGMQAEWELCNHIYYGVIQPFLTTLPLGKTEAEIIAVFESLCQDKE